MGLFPDNTITSANTNVVPTSIMASTQEPTGEGKGKRGKVRMQAVEKPINESRSTLKRKSSRQSHSKDSDEEEYRNDDEEEYEIETKTSSRSISSHMLSKMKVNKDDFVITSKRLNHRNHQIYINVTRLQELIRSEGKKIEKDPFIK